VSVDAASLLCCCAPTVPTSCLDIWQCSVPKFRLDYEIGVTSRIVGTSISGQQIFEERISTLSGFATFQKAATAPPPFGIPTLYGHVGPSQFNYFNRNRYRRFFSNPNCQPCGSTYLFQESLITGSGAISTTSAQWGNLVGFCRSCSCNFPNDPKHGEFLIGGFGSFTTTVTNYNEQGTPSTGQGSGTSNRYILPSVFTPDGCISTNSFTSAMWGNGSSTATPQVLIPQVSFPSGCTDIAIPTRCDFANPCSSVNSGPNYNASGCAAIDGEFFRVCQQGAGFVCECDGVSGNGCVPTIITYEKFGIFTASVVL